MRALPKSPSSDALGEVQSLLDIFSRDLAKHIQGTPDPNGLLQLIKPFQLEFKKAIWITAPNFVPFKRPVDSQLGGLQKRHIVPKFLQNEEDKILLTSRTPRDVICIDDVMDRAQR